MKKSLIWLVLILLLSLSSCVTKQPIPISIQTPPVDVDLEVVYPFKPVLELPKFPEYPKDMDWQWDTELQRFTIPETDMDRLISWRIAVEAFPEKVKIVYEYYFQD
jgi:hypothetical protein